jgi:uncharacterized protein (DUF433 family)
MPVAIKYEYIEIGEDNVARIVGTTTKVVELIEEKVAHGWSPEEMHFQHTYLSMSQIHSALAYYWDNSDEIHKQIENRLRLSDQMRQASNPSQFKEKLKAKGLL